MMFRWCSLGQDEPRLMMPFNDTYLTDIRHFAVTYLTDIRHFAVTYLTHQSSGRRVSLSVRPQ